MSSVNLVGGPPTADSERKELKQARRRIRAMLSDYSGSDRGLEWLSGLLMIWWCVTLALPGDALSTQPILAPFLRWGISTRIWVALFGIIGVARIVALYINGRWPHSPTIRMIGAFFGAVVWAPTFILLMEGFSAYHSSAPGPGAYALLAVADLLAIRRAAHDVRYYSR